MPDKKIPGRLANMVLRDLLKGRESLHLNTLSENEGSPEQFSDVHN